MFLGCCSVQDDPSIVEHVSLHEEKAAVEAVVAVSEEQAACKPSEGAAGPTNVNEDDLFNPLLNGKECEVVEECGETEQETVILESDSADHEDEVIFQSISAQDVNPMVGVTSEALRKMFASRCRTSRSLDAKSAKTGQSNSGHSKLLATASGTQDSPASSMRRSISTLHGVLLTSIDPRQGLRRADSVANFVENVLTKYTILRELGKGGFGTVEEVVPKERKGEKKNKEHFAMKSIPISNLKDQRRFEKELEVACRLNHPNIIRLHEVFRDNERFHLVMEITHGGDLWDAVLASKRQLKGQGTAMGLDSAQVANYAWQMLTGIAYLHHYSFAHRDVKPENYMLATAAKGSPIKLIDFGLARSYRKGDPMTSRVGTPHYVAPEVVDGDNTLGYDAKCDIWSIGVSLWYCSVGELPFWGVGTKQVLKAVTKAEYTFLGRTWKQQHKHPDGLLTLIKTLLHKDPFLRPAAKQVIMTDQWLIDNKQDHKSGLPQTTCCAVS